jgi:hypothetical protein
MIRLYNYRVVMEVALKCSNFAIAEINLVICRTGGSDK